MADRLNKRDKMIADALRQQGYPHTADYIEMFGADNMNPWFWKGPTKQSEAFYKQCVDEGHPWNHYTKSPDKDVVF